MFIFATDPDVEYWGDEWHSTRSNSHPETPPEDGDKLGVVVRLHRDVKVQVTLGSKQTHGDRHQQD